MSSPEQIPNTLDIAQASELTGLSKKALRRRLERGTLDSIKVGGRRMIPISELESHNLLERPATGQAPASRADLSSANPDRATPAAEQPSPAAEQPSPAAAEQPSSAAPSPRASASQANPVPPPSTLEAGPVVSQTPGPGPVAPPTPEPVPVAPPIAPPPTPQASPAPLATGAPAVSTPGYPPGQPMPPQAYAEPRYPERGGWYFWYEYPALRWLAVLLVLALVGLVVWLLAFRSNDGTAVVERGGGPVGVTEQDLIALSQQLHQPIYWAGTMPGTRMELTETNNSYAYIRYLTEDAAVGDTSPNFLTVGTYPSPNAYGNLHAYAKGHPRATTKQIQNGGIAVVIPGSPTSVYFAYPHEDVQVEVYDPQQGRALDLVKSGVVRSVTVSTSVAGTVPSTTGTVTVPTTTPSNVPTVPQG